MPLGPNITARTPHDLLERAAAALRGRDPEFEFSEWPTEICVGEKCVIGRFRATLGEYELFTVHSARRGIPGISECASLRHRGFPEVVAQASAMLLDAPGSLSIKQWPDKR